MNTSECHMALSNIKHNKVESVSVKMGDIIYERVNVESIYQIMPTCRSNRINMKYQDNKELGHIVIVEPLKDAKRNLQVIGNRLQYAPDKEMKEFEEFVWSVGDLIHYLGNDVYEGKVTTDKLVGHKLSILGILLKEMVFRKKLELNVALVAELDSNSTEYQLLKIIKDENLVDMNVKKIVDVACRLLNNDI